MISNNKTTIYSIAGVTTRAPDNVVLLIMLREIVSEVGT